MAAFVAIRGGQKEARRAVRAMKRAGYGEFSVSVMRCYSLKWPSRNLFRSVKVTITVPLCYARYSSR